MVYGVVIAITVGTFLIIQIACYTTVPVTGKWIGGYFEFGIPIICFRNYSDHIPHWFGYYDTDVRRISQLRYVVISGSLINGLLLLFHCYGTVSLVTPKTRILERRTSQFSLFSLLLLLTGFSTFCAAMVAWEWEAPHLNYNAIKILATSWYAVPAVILVIAAAAGYIRWIFCRRRGSKYRTTSREVNLGRHWPPGA